MSTAIEKSRTAAAKRILKVIENENKHRKTQYPVGYWTQNNCQYINNGYVGAVIHPGHDAQGIPQTENNQIFLPMFDKLINNAAETITREITPLVPSVQEIKAYEKEVKSKTSFYKNKQGIPLFIGDDLVNTYHLLSIMQLLPGAQFFVHPEYMVKPIYLVSDYGWGMLLPINPLGAVNGEDEFRKRFPAINSPLHPENVFCNEEHKRYE